MDSTRPDREFYWAEKMVVTGRWRFLNLNLVLISGSLNWRVETEADEEGPKWSV